MIAIFSSYEVLVIHLNLITIKSIQIRNLYFGLDFYETYKFIVKYCDNTEISEAKVFPVTFNLMLNTTQQTYFRPDFLTFRSYLKN